MSGDPTIANVLAELRACAARMHDDHAEFKAGVIALVASLDRLGDGVHRTNNLIQAVLSDAQVLLDKQELVLRGVERAAKSTPPPPMKGGT